MEPQYALALETAQDQLEFDFDFLGPLSDWAVNVPSHIWPLFALDSPPPPIPDGIDEVFAQSNPRTASASSGVASAMDHPFTFALSDADDQGVETEDEERVCVNPLVEFPPPVAIDDIEEENDSEDDASGKSEPTSVEAPNPATPPRAIAPLPPRRSSRNDQPMSITIPGQSIIAPKSKTTPTSKVSSKRKRMDEDSSTSLILARKISSKRKRVDEDLSRSSILALAAQGDNNTITSAPKTSAQDGPATRRRKVQDGTAIPVAQSTQVRAAQRCPTRPAPLPQLLKIGQGFERPAFATTHKRQCADGWNSTACLMCGVPRRRRKLNDTAHSHRSAEPRNKGRMPFCACMQAIGVHYDAESKADYKHSNMANFGLVLLYRYPELVDAGFEHDQITGLAASDLKKWWDASIHLQVAHKEGHLSEALEDAARQVGIMKRNRNSAQRIRV